MKLMHIVGARPNFPKLAPVFRAAVQAGVEQVVVHTGQHYDDRLSGSFFRTLGIPAPDINLHVGSASHAQQTAAIMQKFEPVLVAEKPDWLVVYGDVNSTMATAIVASKLGVPIAHVEAGLRSGDRTMPEEINRLITDRLASLLLTPSRDADEILIGEGVPAEQIAFVGNVMIDTLFASLDKARSLGFAGSHGLGRDHVVVTLHRPSNVDDPERLSALMAALATIAESRPVVFPVHPRTRAQLDRFNVLTGSIRMLDPVEYVEMLDLVQSAYAVVTDSGGLQEETTALGVPCFTVRDNTERPITITEGTNQLVLDPAALPVLVRDASSGVRRVPEGWDGNAGKRVVAALQNIDSSAAASLTLS